MSITLQGEAQDIDKLEKLLEKGRKDRERLDWIEKSGGRCGQLNEGEYFAHMAAQGDKYETGKTLREAIDAAIKMWG